MQDNGREVIILGKMSWVESKLQLILEGNPAEDNPDLCDFTLTSQNEATAAKGIKPSTPSDYVPVVQNTVSYIVMAVLFNPQGEVLLMQEAKRSCAGQWYLPAGRMEPGENIKEAVVREVLEETGLDFIPESLVAVETASKAWFRFVLTGTTVGGLLKTPAQADSESLQAKWIQDVNNLSLRSSDIVPLIERCRSVLSGPRHPDTLPALHPHDKLLLRLVIVSRQKSTNRVHVLVSEKTEAHLPLCQINHNKNLLSTLRKFMVDIFGIDVPAHKPHGLLSVEHCGAGESDGVCLTMLISFKLPLEHIFPIDKYSWTALSKSLGERLAARLPRNMTIPLNVIR